MADNNTLNFDLDAPAVPTLTLDPTPEAAAEEKKSEPVHSCTEELLTKKYTSDNLHP